MSEELSSEAGGVAEVAEVGDTGRSSGRDRRRIARIAGVGVLLVAVVVGVAGTSVRVSGADRDPGAPSWDLPRTVKERAKEAAAGGTGLQALLLPFGTDGFGRGPDIGRFGSDARLSGSQAGDLRKESIKDLPRSQRTELERLIDEQQTKGMAMRSYLSTEEATNSTLYAARAYTVSIVLSQLGDQRTVRNVATAQQEFFDALKIFRKGPEVKGHKDAACFLPPADPDEKLDTMVCSAYVGDVLVSATATGAKPLDQKGVALLLGEQLDRIKNPGVAV
ncbi:hypothetical protein [Streptomyces fuscichromogenes]|uniref:Secreted protein n=1 Tax=Streptomyces fuscichromogenes TaxID=1324013 RepID=A0A917XHA6_9ACTN|nr:hypothetical protein [Streptomyces fuscichromogenes]GGN25665.1 hypothetical protein GCM10011578_059750 [Streptomyces fuscichromogenes]